MKVMAIGKVYLVGAGPGDPKLITVRGLEAIERADVVVYDRLASPRLLRHMKKGAQKIYVGKLPDRHTLKQEEINDLLLELALQGKIVTRLKGGDPAVFGRVGEEALLLAQHGVPYEWIPGITSAIAVPAYAGIPITHRGLTSSFAVVTGHECPKKDDSDLDWKKLATATGTLVFLMGVKNLSFLCEQLIACGRSADTPVAVIRWGTCSEQTTVTGTVATIVKRVTDARLTSPAITIVGDVVSLREHLAWYEKKPLFGQKIIVTRARSQASKLIEQIEDLGGEAIELPLIETKPVLDEGGRARVQQALATIESYEWLVFTSVNGVHYFFEELLEAKIDIRKIRAKMVAVGAQTAAALAERGLMVEFIPEAFQAEALLPYFEKWNPAKILLARASIATEGLRTGLLMLGYQVDDIAFYDTCTVMEQDEYAIEQLVSGNVHAITFTSSSTVEHFLALLSKLHYQLPQNCRTICIGPVTAETASSAGLHVTCVAEHATIDSLVETLIQSQFEANGERGTTHDISTN
jgi:uroporphyrinogen III methyltransferase/synthase